VDTIGLRDVDCVMHDAYCRPACRYVDKRFTLPHSIRSIILLQV
jgi:hypothetical protein